MTTGNRTDPTRRGLLTGAVAAGVVLASPAVAAQESDGVRRNASSFRVVNWQDHFDDRRGGVILVDTRSRYLQYWSEDGGDYRIYPTSVPQTDRLTRRGYTSVIRKVDGPDWAPTENMLERDSSLPRYVAPGPDNPLGTHALYLSWQYYRIHGTNDTRKIGRRSSSGCIGLYNEDIAELFALVGTGCQVKLI